jgi:hypothetical protein
MKAQGLPINFIVLAALAILILILAAGFVIGGGTSAGAALSPAQAKNACDNGCLTLSRWTTTQNSPTSTAWPSGIPSPNYCTLKVNLGGAVGNVNCNNSNVGSRCSVTWNDGSNCLVACNSTNPYCA